MRRYSRSDLADSTVLAQLRRHYGAECSDQAEMLADLVEADERRLYLPEGYPSMHAWCRGELGLSQDAASKRIHAARTARRFPAIFAALADGRLHLSAVVMLAGRLTAANAEELLAAAAHRSKSEIARWLTDLARRHVDGGHIRTLPVEPEPFGPVPTPLEPALSDNLYAPGHVGSFVLTSMDATAAAVTLAPAVQVSLGERLQEKLRYVQELLGHRGPSGRTEELLERAVDLLIREAEKRKFGATERPRRCRMTPSDSRHVPAEVRRAVWERDGGQCTFVSERGHRCEARTPIEFDHIDAYARGGRATVGNIRLRCRAHNQYAADQLYGAEFMRHKREQVRLDAAERKEASTKSAAAERAKAAAEQDPDRSVIPWLRQLGFRLEEARRGAAACENIPDAPLEQRVRVALSALTRARRQAPSAGCAA